MVAVDLNPWNKVIERVAKDLHSGKLKPSDLDDELVKNTYDYLNKGVAEGYGAKYYNTDAQNTQTVQRIQQNLYQFSGAKTYQQLKEYNSFLVDDKGVERSFNAFKQLVLDQHPKYNKNYLEAEFQTARSSGQMAAKWQGFLRNQDRYPNLKYKTVGDSHVRDEHARLNNFIAAIDDPIWDRIYPPNDWRCRCSISQTNSGTTPEGERPDLSFMKPEFEINVGKTGMVFHDEAHPYYVIPKKDKKRVAFAFESMKTRLAYGKARYNTNAGHKVFVHPFASINTLNGNFNDALLMANKINRNVKLRPFVDPKIIKGTRNNDYIINNKLATRSVVKTLSFKPSFDLAVKQGSTSVVINITDHDTDIKTVRASVIDAFKKADESIKEVILIASEIVESIKRSAL